MLFWHVPAPNEALLISGSKHQDQEQQFRIVTGHGSFVLPVKQKARMLSLALQEAEIVEECVTSQGIRLNVRAVAVFKVGDDPVSIANAARRFLSEQNRMEELVGRVFAGHLRSIVGGLTVEQIIRERDRVAQEIKDGSHAEMEKLGIVVDALQIQEIEDSDRLHQQPGRPPRRRRRQPGPHRRRPKPTRWRPSGSRRPWPSRPSTSATPPSSGPDSWPRPSRPGPRRPRPGPWPRPGPPRTSSSSRPPWPSARPIWPPSGSRPRCGGRPTPRPTGSGPWPRPSGTRPSSRPRARRTGRTTLATAEAQAVKVQADGTAYAERTTAEAQADANKARATSLKDGNQELIAANRVDRGAARHRRGRRPGASPGPT